MCETVVSVCACYRVVCVMQEESCWTRGRRTAERMAGLLTVSLVVRNSLVCHRSPQAARDVAESCVRDSFGSFEHEGHNQKGLYFCYIPSCCCVQHNVNYGIELGGEA